MAFYPRSSESGDRVLSESSGLEKFSISIIPRVAESRADKPSDLLETAVNVLQEDCSDH